MSKHLQMQEHGLQKKKESNTPFSIVQLCASPILHQRILQHHCFQATNSANNHNQIS
uniref:Uncharacterized protein n=1 Tax=Physcomitrium patens TaxID=3218 RepID=A0A2K1KAF4_PHYPA|nr:hypothetical protein PHYPA_009942 [Physcomitrium patens]